VKRKVTYVFLGMVLLMLATPAFAQEATPAQVANVQMWVVITSGFAMAFASALCALGQARATAAAAEGMARNPSAAGPIRFALIIGLVLMESLALYTLVIIFLKVTV
jgi:F-type H+-transporting ATPase subunit c